MPKGAFDFHTLEEVRACAQALGVSLPLREDVSILSTPVTLAGRTLPNRLAIQPMEGCDGTPDGRPGELTYRRYRRFARSGAALLWAEAMAVVPEGRANPRQLWLTAGNVSDFARLAAAIKADCQAQWGFEPLLLLQATHSGRYSRPEGAPAPLVAQRNPSLESGGVTPRVLTDDELAALPEAYAATARLAQQAGFDGVDVKCCHGYLLNELMGAFTRPGKYGGDLEGRTRLYFDAIRAAQAAVSGRFIVTSRLNLYDGFARPYGFGASIDTAEMDLTEPLEVVGRLHQALGLPLLDITMGNPYANPHVNRPYNAGGYAPPEHPLCGVARMMNATLRLKAAYPSLALIGSGLSFLRQYAAPAAAGLVAGGVDMAGFGRMAFAYPDFAADLLQRGALEPKRCCLTCGKCTHLMRGGSPAGCPVFDRETYLPLYRALPEADA